MEVHIRPLVLKLEPKFREYIRKYGAICVEGCLRNGSYGRIRLTIMTNKKDRFQMLQVLGMEQDHSEPFASGQHFRTDQGLPT